MNDIDRGGLLELFVDSLPDHAMCLLDVDGKILSWNAGASRMMGYSADEIVGRNLSSLYTAEDAAAAKPATSREQARLHGRHEEVGRRVRQNGTAFDARSTLTALHPAGKPMSGYGILIREAAGLARTAPTLAAGGPGKVIPLAGRKKILVVDDNAEILETVAVQLTNLGYKAIVAPDGAAALDILSSVGDIDLLLTDVVMPGGMNGSQLAVEARRLRPGLKVLFTSGYFEVALVRDGTLDAGTQVLAKPYRKHQLAQSVSEALSS
jgi:PAS domain S-box-containing protein